MSLPNRLTERVALHLKAALLDTYEREARTIIVGASPGGDATFRVDAFAEDVLADFLTREAVNVAVYSEDRGLVRFGNGEPKGVLIVDPIDGTRPFMAGLPVAMVSVALAAYKERPTFDDLREGCLIELAGDRVLFARGAEPPVLRENGASVAPIANPNEDLSRMSWAFEVAGRPMGHVTRLLSDLIDRSSLTGGCFTLAASAYAISRVVQGTLGAFIDVGGWLLDAGLVDEERAMGLYPYDIAAAWLIARNAGCHITDFYGKPLGGVPLTASGPDHILSCVATSNLALHRNVLAYLKERAEAVLAEG
jgi:myo-inositol-1(or 4)-monophosphatase